MRDAVKKLFRKILDAAFSEVGRWIAAIVMSGTALGLLIGLVRQVNAFVVGTLWPLVRSLGLWPIVAGLLVIIFVLVMKLVAKDKAKDVRWLRHHQDRLVGEYNFLMWYPANRAYRAPLVGLSGHERLIIRNSKVVIDLLKYGVLTDRFRQGSEFEISEKMYAFLERFSSTVSNQSSKKKLQNDLPSVSFARALLRAITNNPDYVFDKELF